MICYATKKHNKGVKMNKNTPIRHKITSFETLKLNIPDSKFYRLSKFLPNSMRDLLRLLESPQQVQRLINKFGGQTIRLPRRYDPDSNFLRSIFTAEAVKKLIILYGGTDLYISKCSNFIKKMRNVVIMADFDKLLKNNESKRKICSILGCKNNLTDRQIRAIISKKIS